MRPSTYNAVSQPMERSSPPSGQPPETVDKATAEIKERRHDPASKLYHQGDNEAVVGPKFAVLLAPTPDQCTNEIVLAVTPVEETHPKGEALQVATALIKFDTMLRDRTKGSHFVSALVMDGAPDSEIHNIPAATPTAASADLPAPAPHLAPPDCAEYRKSRPARPTAPVGLAGVHRCPQKSPGDPPTRPSTSWLRSERPSPKV